METHEQRQAAYGVQVRAKYDTQQLKELGAKGHAFKNASGEWSYPIDDEADLKNAIHAVGRGGADHDAIRKYIMGRAKDMGKSSLIPDTWNADGSLKSADSADPEGEQRAEPTVEDYSVAHGLADAKMLLAGVKAKQLADPDLKTDPDDQMVLEAIEKTEKSLDKAIVAQSKDGHPDKPERSKDWATAKRAFSSLVERPPPQAIEAQIRMDEGSDPNLANFRGYAYTIDNRYDVTDWLGVYSERIGPGASSKTLREQESIPMLLNHSEDMVIANTRSGTSHLSDDGRGLLNLATLDRRQSYTNDSCISLARGDVAHMSFSFRSIVEEWNDLYDDRYVRELQLYDTSIVTYPANPATSAELVGAMRSAMGREGRSLWLAPEELSVRSAFREARPEGSELDDLLERAVRALAHADEVVATRGGAHGRARTFQVAGAMLELRAGKTLSAKNESLLKGALDAPMAADSQHQKMATNHADARDKVADVLATANAGAGGDGESNQVPPGNSNPISPKDGAGPRSLPPAVVQARRQLETLKRR